MRRPVSISILNAKIQYRSAFFERNTRNAPERTGTPLNPYYGLHFTTPASRRQVCHSATKRQKKQKRHLRHLRHTDKILSVKAISYYFEPFAAFFSSLSKRLSNFLTSSTGGRDSGLTPLFNKISLTALLLSTCSCDI